MRLLNLEWRNIKSYGNKIQRVDFSQLGGLILVLGSNGTGKSSFLDIPKLLFYGKQDRIKKEDIANRLNKHGWIRGNVEINNDTVATIERTFAPSNLLVEKNGEDIGKAGISDYQTYIDNEITELPYHIFSNVISLSVNDFKSFISMTPNDKRIIIDKLFAMEIINIMNRLVKKEANELKLNLSIYDTEIISLQSSIDTASKELEELAKQTSKDNNKQIELINAKLQEIKPKLQEAIKKREIYNNKKIELNNALQLIINQKAKINQLIHSWKEKKELYEQDKCPTCSTSFHGEDFNLIKGEIEEKISKYTNDFETIKSTELKYTQAKSNVVEGFNKLNQYVIQVQSTCNYLEEELQKINAIKDNPMEFNSIKKIISDSNEKIKQKSIEKISIDTKYKYLSLLEQIYSEDGIKKRILESYLPTLNAEIDYTLRELHFPYNLQFNSEFNPELTQLGLDVNPESLSVGEKKKVDLAVLISIIRMIKRKYPKLNIFMLDEVLSSIDSNGIYDIISLLNKTAKELHMNIIIVNHAPLPIEFFSYKIELVKNDGFSDMIMEKLETREADE